MLSWVSIYATTGPILSRSIVRLVLIRSIFYSTENFSFLEYTARNEERSKSNNDAKANFDAIKNA